MGTSVGNLPTLKVGFPLATNSRFIDALANEVCDHLLSAGDHDVAVTAWMPKQQRLR